MKNPLDLSPLRFWTLVFVITPLIASLVTLATGYFRVPSFSGGLPVAWRELLFVQCEIRTSLASCRGPSLIPCYACPVITQINYDWPSFAIDLIFNTAVGYLAILVLPTAIRLVGHLDR